MDFSAAAGIALLGYAAYVLIRRDIWAKDGACAGCVFRCACGKGKQPDKKKRKLPRIKKADCISRRRVLRQGLLRGIHLLFLRGNIISL